MIRVLLEHADRGVATEAFGRVAHAFEQAEQRMSRFRPNSELSQLNARAGEWVVLSPALWRVIVEAYTLAAETGGLFDPTLCIAIAHAGYAASFEQGPASMQASDRPQLGRWRELAFDPARWAVRLPRGAQLDLGGIGKGFTAQAVVDWLRDWGPCLIDAGGDVTAGAAPASLQGWPVGIAAPWEQGQPDPANLVRLWLADATLATSGIDYRQWEIEGRKAHHIMDPRLGISAETDLVTCSVISAEASRAEAWATATLVAGSAFGQRALSERQLAAALINQNGDLMLTAAMQAQVQLEPDANLRLI